MTPANQGPEIIAAEETFRLLVESIQDYAVFMVDPDGYVVTWNVGAERLKGYRADEIIGQHLATFYPVEDQAKAGRMLQTAATAGRASDEGWRVRKDGSRFWAYGVITAMRDEAGKLLGFSKVAHDMTELRRVREVLETKVQERTAQLQASLNSIEELLYTIAHDLRAPNRSMQGFAQLLKEEYGSQLDHMARDYLDRIAAAAVRNDDLIRDLLEYGRVSHEAAPLAPVDLRRAVESIVRALEGEIEKSHAHIRLGREWPFVLANEPLLKQILTNLATNALTYVPSDRKPEILISASERDGKTVLRVEDNGIGIPPEQIDRVFMPFVRLPNPVNATGTGMGLAIVKKAAERMNGVLGVESTPGKGSCFKLELSTA